MPRYLFSFLLALLLLTTSTACGQTARDGLEYYWYLKSGDVVRGSIIEDQTTAWLIMTELGEITIPKSLISRVNRFDGPQHRPPHHFLMPTASANGPGGFISNYELGFLFGGFGFGGGATITGGMTLVPGVALDKQFFHVGAKFTLEKNEGYELAVGAAYSFFTTEFPYAHIYGVATLPIGTGRYSATIFYKVSGQDAAPISLQAFNFDTTRFTIHYAAGLGAGFGFDAPAFGREDIYWVGEIWNSDITRPQNTVSMIGIRLHNDRLSADFGIAIFTEPFVLPVFRFGWRIY